MPDSLPRKQDSTKESKPSLPAAEKPKRRSISWKDDEVDVRYKFWHLTVQYSSLVLAIFGFLVLWSSLKKNTQSVRANVQNGMLTQVAGLSKTLMDKPELYTYFYKGEPPPDPKLPCVPHSSGAVEKAQSPCYVEVLAAAISKADVLDLVSTQSTRFPDLWDDPEAWDRWVEDSIKQSPILRDYLQNNCRWYGTSLIKHLKKVDEALSPKEFPTDCQQYLDEKKAQ